MDSAAIEQQIKSHMDAHRVRVQSPDGVHFEALVVSDAFNGKATLARHRLVHEALGPALGREIHAMTIKTFTPQEYEELG